MPSSPKNTVYCNKYRLKKRYGITPEQYVAMLASVGGLCEICGTVGYDGKKLSVDHCHETGKIRGLLCNRCNMALGAFNDSPRLLSRAIKYITTRGGRVTPCAS